MHDKYTKAAHRLAFMLKVALEAGGNAPQSTSGSKPALTPTTAPSAAKPAAPTAQASPAAPGPMFNNMTQQTQDNSFHGFGNLFQQQGGSGSILDRMGPGTIQPMYVNPYFLRNKAQQEQAAQAAKANNAG